jgi:hypothetical protein
VFVAWEAVGAERFRHPDHGLEWSRQEFRDWAQGIANRFGDSVKFLPVGPECAELAPPTQMGVFETH